MVTNPYGPAVFPSLSYSPEVLSETCGISTFLRFCGGRKIWVDAFHRLAAETPARPRPSNKALANFCDWLRRALPRRRPTTCELGAAFRAALEFDGAEAPVLTVRYLRSP